ncbi:MAG: RNA 2',3'-cyclic phosphodiesterase [Kiritimatiellia bacterium]
MRTFAAVDINDKVRGNLEAVQRGLSDCGASLRWIPSGNLHLTLVFLGEIDRDSVDGITKRIRTSVSGTGPFVCRVKGIGYFGRKGRPRIIRAGIEDGNGILKNLQGRLTGQLVEEGLSVDKRDYVPHLTLARVKSGRNARELATAIHRFEEEDFGTFRVSGVKLVESVLTPEGPVYSQAAFVPLKEG